MFSFLKPRLKPIFLTPELNGPAQVTINLYQNFVFVALKVLVYANCLERDDIAKIRPDLWVRAVKDASDFTECMLRKSNPGLMLPLPWLCLSAFISVFRAKKNRISKQKEALRLLCELELSMAPNEPWSLDFRALMNSGKDLIDNMLV